jgi:hypothetical protein
MVRGAEWIKTKNRLVGKTVKFVPWHASLSDPKWVLTGRVLGAYYPKSEGPKHWWLEIAVDNPTEFAGETYLNGSSPGQLVISRFGPGHKWRVVKSR